MSRHTYDFGLIGNCSYLALIGKDTNVNWMCLPRFDSSFIFGSLLDTEKGGEFSIKPADENFHSEQKYLQNSNILETTIESGESAYKVTDFAPRFHQYERYYRPLMLIRKIEPLKGYPRLKICCKPVGKYGELELKPERGSNHIRYIGLKDAIRLTSDISLNYILEDKEFVLNRTYYMVFTYGVPLEGPLVETTEDFLQRTLTYWRRWVKSTSIGSLYQNEVIRSALTLKICQYEDTGGIIAAPTTSLPEAPGSGRNWDYRYCWMRDTFYILNAFNNVGHFEEMEKYFLYLTNIPMPDDKRIQPLYDIIGNHKITEDELSLAGYRNNKPVRVGNAAYTHTQNDVYGQILLAILPLYLDERFNNITRERSDYLLRNILSKMEMTIDEPDAGIWEFRHKADHHAYTNLFQWAGSQAAMKVARLLDKPDLYKRAKILMHKADEWIKKCYLKERNAYGQGVHLHNMDASTFQLIMMNYLPHNSQNARDQLSALEEDLKGGKSLFYRYREDDGFGKTESSFLICGFWYAEALACVGRLDDAQEVFADLCSYSNHLGLLSEDVNPKDGSMWGNFPQAYSHVGLVNAATRINNRLDRPIFM